MIGIILLASASLAGASPVGPTLAQWSQNDEESRRIVLTGAVEGVLLATSAQNGLSVPVNTDCFSMISPANFDARLMEKSKTNPDLSLVKALIEMNECRRKGGAK